MSTAVTIYGVAALTFMMVMYTLERRHHRYVLGFAIGCVLSSGYGFVAGAWPFGVIELIWAGLALRRWRVPVALSLRADWVPRRKTCQTTCQTNDGGGERTATE